MAQDRRRQRGHSQPSDLLDGEAGAIQIGPTDHGMARIIVTTPSGVLELDFSPEEALEIAQELTAAAEIATSSAKKAR